MTREVVRGLRNQIVDQIRGDVFSGRLAEAEHLSEMSLAQRFGVSRAPIREALVQLTQEGLVLSKPHCGVRVAASSLDSVRALIIPIRRTYPDTPSSSLLLSNDRVPLTRIGFRKRKDRQVLGATDGRKPGWNCQRKRYRWPSFAGRVCLRAEGRGAAS
jgi:DNA-binding transcriptional MocR family regulator